MGQSLSIQNDMPLNSTEGIDRSEAIVSKKHLVDTPNSPFYEDSTSPVLTSSGNDSPSAGVVNEPRRIIQINSPLFKGRQGPRMEIQNLDMIKPSVNSNPAPGLNVDITKVKKTGDQSIKIKQAFTLIDKGKTGKITCNQLVNFLCGKSNLPGDQNETKKADQYREYLQPMFNKNANQSKC